MESLWLVGWLVAQDDRIWGNEGTPEGMSLTQWLINMDRLFQEEVVYWHGSARAENDPG